MSVYGIGRNEKRDAPYKIGRRSGRKTDATKYDVALRSAADAKWFLKRTENTQTDLALVVARRKDTFWKLTLARGYAHSHNFKADSSLTPFLVLSDLVMVAGKTPSNARPRFPKKKKEEEATAVRRTRLGGSVARRMRCWVRVSIGSVMLSWVGRLHLGGDQERGWAEGKNGLRVVFKRYL